MAYILALLIYLCNKEFDLKHLFNFVNFQNKDIVIIRLHVHNYGTNQVFIKGFQFFNSSFLSLKIEIRLQQLPSPGGFPS